MSLFYLTSIALVIKTISVLTIGLDASSLKVWLLWLLPFVQVNTFNIPFFFSDRKIKLFLYPFLCPLDLIDSRVQKLFFYVIDSFLSSLHSLLFAKLEYSFFRI